MRLIDADALQKEYKKLHDGKRSLLIDTAPTIIAEPSAYQIGYEDGFREGRTRRELSEGQDEALHT